jgi:hypothetical protein
MKILHRGILPEEKTYRAECNSCRTTYEFLGAEVKKTEMDRNDTCLVTECPVCHKDVWTTKR